MSGLRRMRHLATLSLLYLTTLHLVVVASASADSTGHDRASNSGNLSAGKLRSLGEIALSERKYNEAESYYRQAIALEPHNGNNYYKLFKVHNRMRALGDALTDLTEACEREPGRAEWRVQKAKLLVSLGRCEEAVNEYNLVERKDKDNDNDNDANQNQPLEGENDASQCAQLTAMAVKAFSEEDFHQSVHFFNKALSYMTEASDLLYMKAQAEYRLEDYYGVISDTGRILKSFPKHIEAYQLRGEAYFMLNEMDMAVKHFREGLKLDPEHKGQ